MKTQTIKQYILFLGVVIFLSGSLKVIGQEKQVKTLTDSILVIAKELNLQSPNLWTLQNDCDFSTDIKSEPAKYFKPVTITLPKGATPEEWTGYGCFTAVINIDSSLYGKKVAIRGLIRGALELYVNGESVGKAGTVGTKASDEISIGLFAPIEFNFSHQPEQLLGIKYSNHAAKNFYNKDDSGLYLFIGLPENVNYAHNYFMNRSDSTKRRFFLIFGFMAALGLLHLFLFIFYPSEKANLTCSLLFFFISIIFLSGMLFDGFKSTNDYMNLIMVEGIGTTLTSSILLFFIYQIIKWRFNWLPFLFLGLGLITLILVINNPIANQLIYNVYFLVACMVGIFVLIYARLKQNLIELNIILVFYFIALVLLVPNLLSSILDWKILWYNNLTLMNLSAIPAAMGYSLFLARGVAKTNKNLKQQLKENERLNSEKLKSETEKKLIIENQKKNLELEVKKRTADLRKSLKDLKSAQSQLIQSEKMASLGELTAGIAHEIQNPLNFVNNFSEVSNELVDEMNEELDKGDLEEAKEISKDLKQNLEKIIHHGERADSIVKGMLQHSRASSGNKEPTDINALADEYLRLAYHGLRAKDKSFNAQLVTHFDDTIGKINILPQDVGRVVLNLLTNAFYAVHEKAKANLNNFEPTVSIKTKKTKDSVILEVKDNGNGMPNTVKDKIFQPFFTTKPTGQGTGLGLSLSYDIITKGHGGTLSVETVEGKGTTFNITIPIIN